VTRLEDGTFRFRGTSPDIVKAKNKALEPFGYELKCYGLKLRILPTMDQEMKLSSNIGCARVVHNDYIQRRKRAYQNHEEPVTYGRYMRECLPALLEERKYLAEADRHALGFAAKHADTAFQNFFKKKSKYPRYASKNKPSGNRYESSFDNDRGLSEKNGEVFVSLCKVGKVKVAIQKHQTIQDLVPKGARITGVTISREADRYYVSLHISLPVPKMDPVKEVRTDRIYAADMGIKSFAVIGKGLGGDTEVVDNPRWVKKQAKKISRLQRSLTRKKKGSKNYMKAKNKLAKAQKKIANQRADYQHKLSRSLADSCDVFVCEDLNIRGMLRNHKLAREISSAGWGMFLNKVNYKMLWRGGTFIKVDRFFPSSKRCHVCGYHKDDLSLEIREWDCPVCGTHLDRDGNAAQNLIKEGIRLLKKSKGDKIKIIYEDAPGGKDGYGTTSALSSA